MTTQTSSYPVALTDIRIGGAQLHALNVQLLEDLILDEVHLEGGDIRAEMPAVMSAPPHVRAEAVQFRVVMSEPNLNRCLAASQPPDALLRGLKVSVLSGKLRVTGQIVKIISMPITLEAIPRIDNGVRVSLDWQGMKVGIGLPKAMVDILEEQLNKTIDLTQLPIPVWVDEIRCEPGRLTAIGRARVDWPPLSATPPALPFTARDPAPLVRVPEPQGVLSSPETVPAAIEAGSPDALPDVDLPPTVP